MNDIFHFVQESYNLKMIQLYKGEETTKRTLEQKAYFPWPKNMGDSLLRD